MAAELGHDAEIDALLDRYASEHQYGTLAENEREARTDELLARALNRRRSTPLTSSADR